MDDRGVVRQLASPRPALQLSGRSRVRTRDRELKRLLLYQLSYTPELPVKDLNLDFAVQGRASYR